MAQPGGGQVQRRLPIRECADDTGSPPYLAQDAFQRVVGSYPPPVLFWKSVVAKRLFNRIFHKLGGPRQPLLAQLGDENTLR